MSRQLISMRWNKDLLTKAKALAAAENRSLTNFLETLVMKASANDHPRGEIDALMKSAIDRFLSLIPEHYKVADVILYGSRARGDHSLESDVDLAIILKGRPQRFLAVAKEFASLAYDVQLDTGFYISPLPIWEREWKHPEKAENPSLINNIVKEGVRV
jgi:predicted nucleotidyltransferase